VQGTSFDVRNVLHC